MKVFVVLNPAAGQEKHASVREALRRRLGAARIPYEIHETVAGESVGEAVRAGLRNGFDLVVAAGGDGTVPALSTAWLEPRSRSASSRPEPGI